jgi:osmotically-inducible protein OsmY
MIASFVVVVTGCADVRDQQTVGTYVDDSAVTARVKVRLADDSAVSALAIGVRTLKGVVHLSGFAKDARERERAEQLARRTPGVVAVRDHIVLPG